MTMFTATIDSWGRDESRGKQVRKQYMVDTSSGGSDRGKGAMKV